MLKNPLPQIPSHANIQSVAAARNDVGVIGVLFHKKRSLQTPSAIRSDSTHRLITFRPVHIPKTVMLSEAKRSRNTRGCF
jgi:hypothetical protein